MIDDSWQVSIGAALAIELGESGWWKNKTPEEIVRFQLFTEELCMPFGDFHKAVEDALKRPVWTHEFGTACGKRLRDEFLGKKPAPSFDEIVAMIPGGEKRFLVRRP